MCQLNASCPLVCANGEIGNSDQDFNEDEEDPEFENAEEEDLDVQGPDEFVESEELGAQLLPKPEC